MRIFIIVVILFLVGCVSGPQGGIGWERSAGKVADDELIGARCVGVMGFARVEFSSGDGLRIPAYLFTPPPEVSELSELPGGLRPAVIYLHGGEHGTFSARGLRRVGPLVERGWMVLAVDYRGSSGYGDAFYEAADYGGREIDDVLAARAWLVGEGLVSPDKIGVLGASHGGYTALMAVAREPEGFSGCVDFYGPTDLVYRVTSSLEENPNAEEGDGAKFAAMVGVTVEENEEAYRERSPRFLAGRMLGTPILIIHGTEDEVVGIRESEWLVEALEEAGHEQFEFMRVEGGHHGWPAEVYEEAWERVFGFLEGCLGEGVRGSFQLKKSGPGPDFSYHSNYITVCQDES